MSRSVLGLIVVCMTTSTPALASPTDAEEALLLTPRFRPGRTGYYELTQNAKRELIGTQVPGGSQRGSLTRINGFIEKVEEAGESGARLTLTYDRVCQVHEDPPALDKFDSDDPTARYTNAELGAALSQLIGEPLHITLDKDCRVTRITGMMDIRSKLAKNARGNRYLFLLGKEMTDEMAKMAYAEHRYALYPNKVVKIGDTWERKLQDNVGSVGRIFFEYKCKLDRFTEEDGRKLAIVSYVGHTYKDPTDTRPQGPGGTFDLKGDFSGEGAFDIEIGQFVRTAQSNKVRMEQQTGAPKDEESDGPPSLVIGVSVESKARFCSVEERMKEKAEKHVPPATTMPATTSAGTGPAAAQPVARKPTTQPAGG